MKTRETRATVKLQPNMDGKESKKLELERRTKRNQKLAAVYLKEQFLKSFTSEKSLRLTNEREAANLASTRAIRRVKVNPRRNKSAQPNELASQMEHSVVERLRRSRKYIESQARLQRAALLSHVKKT